MRYDGGARKLHPDGSIEIAAAPRIRVVPALVALLASFALVILRPDLGGVPFIAILLWALVLARRSRRAERREPSRRGSGRRVVFDAGARVLRVVDRGWSKGDRSIPFSEIRTLAVEQREHRRIALPILTVNGEELLSVKDTFDNAHLEEELQALVGLPLRASPKEDTRSGWIDF